VAADITTPEGRSAALAACREPDILINNAGGPPAGDFRDWDRAAWLRAIDANMLTPIELIKATVDAMIARKFGRIVNITSSAVKAPIDILGLSNGARSGLTGFVAGVARKVARHNVTINNLLPGSFETDRLHMTIEARAKASGKPIAEVLQAGRDATPAGRFGTIDEFGAACAFLCSAHAGYIVGQNVLIDGGSYPGTF
jgi:3-oxoacyl-[acyl-carrier protein] reductase